MILKVTFLIYCVLTLCVAQNDNIDTFEPVMRESLELGTFDNDLFGYTVVLHQLVDRGGINNTLIVVSAPLGQAAGTQLPRSIAQDGLSTGVLYTCPINPGSCEGLTGDGNGDDRRLFDIDPNALTSVASDANQGEDKRGQFLGSTLKSTGDTFLVCGHRRLDYGIGFDRNPFGICYHSGRSLTGFNRYDPCLQRNSRSYFGFGQCQAGTSGDIIDGNIFLGAPGSYAWRGAVFRRGNNDASTIFTSNGVGSGSISWQGYEATTGRINSRNPEFIVSAPRFNNYRGRVNIYPNSGSSLNLQGNNPLAGDQVGSYYGFSMAAVDFQGQGLDDLLVSAPMYSPEVSRPEYGRVYVYRNNGGILSLFTTLEGRISFGRFGHAMAKLGDINGDSYEDVAISEPFGEQAGKVYIYAGAGSSLINQNPIQIIDGSQLNLVQLSGTLQLRSFGSSLSSNVDVDNNGFNDLAIGAFRSQRVFVLRTRPVARLNVDLRPDSTIDVRQTRPVCNNRACFDITVCVQYQGGSGLQSSLRINYALSVDAQTVQLGVPSRVQLINETNSPYFGNISGVLDLTSDVETCVDTIAILLEGVTDLSSSFSVQFTPTLISNRMADPNWDGNMLLSSLDSAPVLSVFGATSALTQFIRNCSSGNLCIPNLEVTIMQDNIQYENNDGVVTAETSIVSGIITSLNIPVRVTNIGEDAFGARIAVTFSRLLVFSRAVPEGSMATITLTCNDITPESETITTTMSCLIANQFLESATSLITFRFQTNAVRGDEGGLVKTFNASSQLPEAVGTTDDNVRSVNVTTSASADLRVLVRALESVIIGETNPREIISVGDLAPSTRSFDVTFTIRNNGPSDVPSARLTIYWPLMTPISDRYYLYPSQTNEGLSCESTYINVGGYRINEEQRNETEPIGKRRRRQANGGSDRTTVSCINGTDSACVAIICNITAISRIDQSVDFTVYPDNRQFFGTRQNWEFVIFARVEILSEFIEDSNNTNDFDNGTLIGIPIIPTSSDDEIEAWVIIVPIVIGVLIIVGIVVALYFLGFFKLKKVDKDEEALNDNQDGVPDGEKPELSAL